MPSTGAPRTPASARRCWSPRRRSRSRAAPTASCSSSGASRAPAARSSTPRCFPTPAPTTATWRRVTDLGARLAALPTLPAPGRDARVALVFDWENWWAVEERDHPTELDYLAVVLEWYGALHAREVSWSTSSRPSGSTTATTSWSRRALYLLRDEGAASLTRFVESGGTLLTGPFTDVVDGHDQFRTGRLPHPARPRARHPLRGLRCARRRDHGRQRRRRAGARAGVGGRHASTFDFGDSTFARPARRRGGARPWPPRSSRPSPTASPPARPLSPATATDAARPGTSRRCPTPRDSTRSSARWSRHPVSRPVVQDLPQGVEAARRGDLVTLINHGDEPVADRRRRDGCRDRRSPSGRASSRRRECSSHSFRWAPPAGPPGPPSMTTQSSSRPHDCCRASVDAPGRRGARHSRTGARNAYREDPPPMTLAKASTPPLGWNSWDCYGTTVTEAEVLANAEIARARAAAARAGTRS